MNGMSYIYIIFYLVSAVLRSAWSPFTSTCHANSDQREKWRISSVTLDTSLVISGHACLSSDRLHGAWPDLENVLRSIPACKVRTHNSGAPIITVLLQHTTAKLPLHSCSLQPVPATVVPKAPYCQLKPTMACTTFKGITVATC